MDNMEIRSKVDKYIKEICHYSQMQVFATSDYQKKYIQYQIDETANELTDFFIVNSNRMGNQRQLHSAQRQPVQPTTQQPIQQPVQQPMQQPGQQPIQQPMPEERVITREELRQYDGSGGNLAYVAVNGNVYDMSNVIQWGGGTHFGLYAGRELTNEFMNCHAGMLQILDKLPKVGVLLQE